MNIEEIKVAASLVGMVATFISIILVTHRLITGSFVHGVKRYELYKELVELCGNDANKEKAKIYVAMQTLTKREFSNREVEWFLHRPGAFRYVAKFGKCIRYIDVNFNVDGCHVSADGFKFKERVATRKKRIIEWLWIGSFYMFFGITGVLQISNGYQFSNGFEMFALLKMVGGFFLVILALMVLGVGIIFLQAYDMPKIKLP